MSALRFRAGARTGGRACLNLFLRLVPGLLGSGRAGGGAIVMATVKGENCTITIQGPPAMVKLRWICEACDWAIPFWMPEGAIERPAICGTCHRPMILFRPVDLGEIELETGQP